METDGKKLTEYVSKNQRYWEWPPNENHQVIFLGYETTKFKFESGIQVPTIRYYFRLINGMEKPIDVRSTALAKMMAQFKSGDCLTLKRTLIGEKKYKYEVSKIE